MSDVNWSEIFSDMFSAKDDKAMDIAIKKNKYERRLDNLWFMKSSEYYIQLNSVKESGYKVYRNGEGKHKIIGKGR